MQKKIRIPVICKKVNCRLPIKLYWIGIIMYFIIQYIHFWKNDKRNGVFYQNKYILIVVRIYSEINIGNDKRVDIFKKKMTCLRVAVYSIYAIMRVRVRLITSASTRVNIPHHSTLTSRNRSQSLLKLFLLLPIFCSSILKPDLLVQRKCDRI